MNVVSSPMGVCASIYISVCVRVCVKERARTSVCTGESMIG